MKTLQYFLVFFAGCCFAGIGIAVLLMAYGAYQSRSVSRLPEPIAYSTPVAEVSASPTDQPTIVPTDIPTPLPTNTSIPTPVVVPTKIAPPTPLAVATASTVTKIAIANRPAQLYQGPGNTFNVIGSVAAEQPLTIIGISLDGQWYQLVDGSWIEVYIVDSQRSSGIAAVTPQPVAQSPSSPPTVVPTAIPVIEAPVAQPTAPTAPVLTLAPATLAVQDQGQIAPTCYDIMVAYNTMTSVQWNVFEKQNRYTWMKGWTGNIGVMYTSGSFYEIGIELADGCNVNVTTSQEEALKYSDGQAVIFDGQIENMSTGLLGGLFINTIASTVVLRPLN